MRSWEPDRADLRRTGMRNRLVVLVLSAVVFGLVFPATANASCIGFAGTLKQRLADAPMVFVGTVTETASDGRLATVKVESVWKGEVTPSAQVAGGDPTQAGISSVDRTYAVGTRYLFTPHAFQGGVYADNACTDTQDWTPKIERLRPEGASPVGGGTAGGGGVPAPAGAAEPSSWSAPVLALAAGAVAVLLTLGAIMVSRRRSTPGAA